MRVGTTRRRSGRQAAIRERAPDRQGVAPVVYELNAVIGAEDRLRAHAARFEHAVVAVLRQGLALIPVTDALTGELAGTPAERPGTDLPAPPAERPFALCPALERSLAQWSRQGPIAYV